MLIPAMAQSLQGLQTNQRAFAGHAERISHLGTTASASDITGDVVGLLVSQHGYEANLAVVGRADEMIGTLIDLLA